MGGPYPLPSLAAQITPAGISAPSFNDVLASLQAEYGTIFGSDVVTDASTQDQQYFAVKAQAIVNANQALIYAYNSFRPTGAVGAGLSSIVKINGIRRLVASNSSAPVLITGQAGTVITNGIVGDGTYQYTLPSPITIPTGGQITETATCTTLGAISAPSGTINQIITPQRGWQSAVSTANATIGAPVETDAALVQRQAISTELPALTPLETIVANLENLAGVTEVASYENDTLTTDANGLAPGQICLVVTGGNAVSIATTIANSKTPGVPTYGSTTEVVIDANGVPNTIKFYVTSLVQIHGLLNITPLTGYVSTTGAAAATAMAAYIAALAIGQNVNQSKLSGPANLYGDAATGSSGMTQAQLDPLSATYDINSIYLARADMTVTASITAGATSVTIGNAASLATGQSIILTNSDGTQSTNVVTGVTGDVVGFTPAVATGKTVSVGALVYVSGNLNVAFNEDAACSASNITLIT